MSSPDLHVLRVFCDAWGAYGNPLGVVLDGAAVPRDDRQDVARDLGFSETVFVDDAAGGRVRIFTPARELPLAGHPLVGTAWLLASAVDGRTPAPVEVLRPPAGDVACGADADGAWIEADPDDAPPFDFEEHMDPADVEALAVPDEDDAELVAWAWIDQAFGIARSRVFAAGHGVREDEATGSAALRLCAAVGRHVEIRQGRGSIIDARPVDGDLVRVGGRVVHDETVPLATALARRAV